MPRNTVALQVRPPEVAQGGAANPFAAGVDIMRMQQLGNENRRFQLQLQANGRIGDIMSAAPSLEEGLAQVARDPIAGAYGSEYLKNMRDMQSALATTQKTELETNRTALQAYTQALAPLYQANLAGASMDEMQAIASGAMRQATALSPPGRAARTNQIVDAVNSALFDGLPADRTQAGVAFGRRMSNMLATSGMGAPEYANIVGKPDTIDDGLHLHTGMNVPGFGFVPSGQVIQKQVPLGTTVTPGQVPLGAQPDPATGLMPSSSMQLPLSPRVRPDFAPGGIIPNQLAPPAPAPTAAAPALTTAPAAPTVAPGSTTTPSAGQTSELTGKPIYDPAHVQVPSVPGTTGTGGRFIWSNPVQEKAAEGLLDHYNTDGHREYEGFTRSQEQLTYIDNAIDQLAMATDDHGLLKPGAFGEVRQGLARAWNTAIDVLQANNFNVGEKDKVDPRALASEESLQKASRLLQYSTVTAAFGAQREAAQTIQSAGKSVPGLENTILGNKLLIESLRTAAQRGVDLRRFQNSWLADPRTHGSLQGSEEEFNRIHPPGTYAQATLDKFGLGANGFQSVGAIENAVQHRWITPEFASQAAIRFERANPQPSGAGGP